MSTLLTIGLANAVCAAALAVPAYLVGRYAKRPALAHALWLLVLLKLVTPPLWRPSLGARPAEMPASPPKVAPEIVTIRAVPVVYSFVDLGLTNPGKPQPMMMMVPIGEKKRAAFVLNLAPPKGFVLPKGLHREKREAASESHSSFADVVVLLWLTGSVLFLGRTLFVAAQFHSLLAEVRRAPPHFQVQADALALQMGMRRGAKVWLLPGALPPMVWGLFRVKLLFPEGLLSRLSEEERASLLAHELAHVRRRDHWVRLLELAALTLFWWLPLTWWARRQLQCREEECCDAWAAGAVAPRVYATAILEAVDFLAEARPRLPAMVSALDSHRELKRRLTLILTSPGPRRLGGFARAGVVAAGLAVLPFLPALHLPWMAAATPPRQAASVGKSEFRAFTWEARSEKPLVRLDGMTRANLSKALIASARTNSVEFKSSHQAAVLWNVESRRGRDRLTDPRETHWQARFSPGGRLAWPTAGARSGTRKQVSTDEFTVQVWSATR